MLKVGVRLPARVVDAGEYLADVRALDAAGVDSLWLDGDGGDEPWLVLASVAAVTGVARLVVPVALGSGQAPAALAARVLTLNRLSRGRVVLFIHGASVSSDVVGAVLAVTREAKCCALLRADTEEQARFAAREASGVVGLDGSPDRFRAAHAAVPSGQCGGAPSAFERWARVTIPDEPAHWGTMRRDYGDAGATGLVLPSDPRLLDLLRNGDDEADRSDLQLSQG
ncbi:MAG TPA: LLM class flavin-dependent oxidoreductase [Candidatus Methylomirabilis sp.]|nr:LLM class flavin-dependent oxidoreductase [Candidatus Methylomirabilis sp.]